MGVKLKFIFIDETSKTKDNKCFLCLCGVVVDSKNVTKLESEIQMFKNKYCFENLKDFRKPENEKEKINKTKELVEILKNNEVVIISSVMLKNSLNTIKNNNRENFEALQRFNDLEFIIERFYFHLNRRRKTGIMIFDSVDNKIKNEMEDLFFNEVSKRFKNIFPSLLFSKDEYSNILQVSDLIGVSLNSALYTSLKNHQYINVDQLPTYNPYLNEYWQLFEVNKDNQLVKGWGLKVWY